MVGDEGYVVAFYATVVEVTKAIMGNCRMASMQHMGPQMEAAKDLVSFWTHLLKSLESNDKHLPLVMLYSVKRNISGEISPPKSELVECVPKGCRGVSEGHASAPPQVNLLSYTATARGQSPRATTGDADIKHKGLYHQRDISRAYLSEARQGQRLRLYW